MHDRLVPLNAKRQVEPCPLQSGAEATPCRGASPRRRRLEASGALYSVPALSVSSAAELASMISANSPLRLARAVRCMRSAGKTPPLGSGRSKVAVASATTTVGKPRFAAIRAVVEQQWSVVRPSITTGPALSARSRCVRSVPMKALLTDFSISGSPAAGRASGLNSKASVPRWKSPFGEELGWRTWMMGASAERQAMSRAAICRSASGLFLGPQPESSKARWTSIKRSVGTLKRIPFSSPAVPTKLQMACIRVWTRFAVGLCHRCRRS